MAQIRTVSRITAVVVALLASVKMTSRIPEPASFHARTATGQGARRDENAVVRGQTRRHRVGACTDRVRVSPGAGSPSRGRLAVVAASGGRPRRGGRSRRTPVDPHDGQGTTTVRPSRDRSRRPTLLTPPNRRPRPRPGARTIPTTPTGSAVPSVQTRRRRPRPSREADRHPAGAAPQAPSGQGHCSRSASSPWSPSLGRSPPHTMAGHGARRRGPGPHPGRTDRRRTPHVRDEIVALGRRGLPQPHDEPGPRCDRHGRHRQRQHPGARPRPTRGPTPRTSAPASTC